MTGTDRAPGRRAVALVAFSAALALAVAGCASGTAPAEVPGEISSRLDAIGDEVAAWRSAGDLAAARRHAEAARNLVVGPEGPYYGDADGDGVVAGAEDAGLLPGLAGGDGLAEPAANACVERDVLGGSWDDPEERWDEFSAVLAAWAPDANTMPQLASHPQRVVGWATLTLDAESLDTAREYAGHAQLHVDITRAAYTSCPG